MLVPVTHSELTSFDQGSDFEASEFSVQLGELRTFNGDLFCTPTVVPPKVLTTDS
jgi:hypothetical protein